MTYANAKKRYDQQAAPMQEHRARTDYRCRANGCPNAGCINDGGESSRGMCWYHFNEPDAKNWDAVTLRIRSNFAEMRNHNEPLSDDLQPPGNGLFEEAPFVYEDAEA